MSLKKPCTFQFAAVPISVYCLVPEVRRAFFPVRDGYAAVKLGR